MTDLGEIGFGGGGGLLNGLFWLRRALVNAGMNLWVPQNGRKFLSICTAGLRKPQLHGVS
jgi:hypothetical protein